MAFCNNGGHKRLSHERSKIIPELEQPSWLLLTNHTRGNNRLLNRY